MTYDMFMASAAVIMAIALICPLGHVIWSSFRYWTRSQTIEDAELVGLGTCGVLWNDQNFPESIWIALKFAFFVISLEMPIDLGLALRLDRNIRGMSVLRMLVLLPKMIAPVVLGLVWRYVYHQTVGMFDRFLEDIGQPLYRLATCMAIIMA